MHIPYLVELACDRLAQPHMDSSTQVDQSRVGDNNLRRTVLHKPYYLYANLSKRLPALFSVNINTHNPQDPKIAVRKAIPRWSPSDYGTSTSRLERVYMLSCFNM